MTDRKIRIIRGFSGYKSGSLCFKTGAPPEIVYDFGFHAFEDSGPEFDVLAPTALQLFYERLVLGDAFPTEMVLSGVDSLQNVFAASLFISPDLVFTAECASLIHAVSMKWKWQDVASAHLSPTHVEVMRAVLQALWISKDKTTIEEDYQRLMRAVSVVESYLRTGSIPPVQAEKSETDIIWSQSDFVVFRSDVPSWDLIYREGYMYGIWLRKEEGSRERPFLFKKSSLIPFDLREVGRLLNDAEFGIKGHEGDGWLRSPDPTLLAYPIRNPIDGSELEGTSLELDTIIELAVSVLKEM